MKDPVRPEDRFLGRLVALERAVRALATRSAPVPSAARPDAAAAGLGTCYFDRALTPPRPIWSDGQTWVFADGSPA